LLSIVGACSKLFSSGFKHPFEVGVLRMPEGASLPLSASAYHSMLAATHTYPLAIPSVFPNNGLESTASREHTARTLLIVVSIVFVFFVLTAFTIF
jgi:hypothetical protein